VTIAPSPSTTTRRLAPLAAVTLVLGLSTALVNPFLALFLSSEVHAGPVGVTVFMALAPLSVVLATTLLARLSDRRSIRRLLLIVSAVAGCAGSIMFAFVRDYRVLLVVAVTATATAGALFPQTFAYARQVLHEHGSARSAMALSTLRTLFSIAWVAGPPLAAVLLGAGGFRYVYATSAVMYAIAAAVAYRKLDELGPAASPTDVDPDHRPVAAATRSRVWTAVAGFAALQCAAVLGVQAMSLHLSHDLHGTVRDAGLILGLCAGLEIPLMLGFGALSARVPLRRLIIAGAACGVVYYGLATAATAPWHLAAGQVLNAAFIAAVSGLGISYVQDMLPGEPGRAATLFTNTFPIGAVLAGLVLGAAQHFGYRTAYGAGTVLCLAGLALLAVPAGLRRTGVSRRQVDADLPGRRRRVLEDGEPGLRAVENVRVPQRRQR
jgi:SET family sugar efflux transporter-like MFS transporter